MASGNFHFFIFDDFQTLRARMDVVVHKLRLCKTIDELAVAHAAARPLWEQLKQHPEARLVWPIIVQYDEAGKAARARVTAKSKTNLR